MSRSPSAWYTTADNIGETTALRVSTATGMVSRPWPEALSAGGRDGLQAAARCIPRLEALEQQPGIPYWPSNPARVPCKALVDSSHRSPISSTGASLKLYQRILAIALALKLKR